MVILFFMLLPDTYRSLIHLALIHNAPVLQEFLISPKSVKNHLSTTYLSPGSPNRQYSEVSTPVCSIRVDIYLPDTIILRGEYAGLFD